MNVYGECNQPSTCTDPCTCGPCSHLQHAQFALHSGPLSETTSPATYNANDACPVKNTPNTCAAVCAQQAVIESSSSPVSSNSNKLSPGAIAGIVIGVLVFVGLMAALAYFVFIRNRLAVS